MNGHLSGRCRTSGSGTTSGQKHGTLFTKTLVYTAVVLGTGWTSNVDALQIGKGTRVDAPSNSGQRSIKPVSLRASRAIPCSADIHELRRLSGLTWEQLAEIFGVSRRTLHLWANDKPASAEHQERLHLVLSAMRDVDRGRASENRKLLLSIGKDGTTPFDLLLAGCFDEFVARVGPGAGRTRKEIGPGSTTRRTPGTPLSVATLLGGDSEPINQEPGKVLESFSF